MTGELRAGRSDPQTHTGSSAPGRPTPGCSAVPAGNSRSGILREFQIRNHSGETNPRRRTARGRRSIRWRIPDFRLRLETSVKDIKQTFSTHLLSLSANLKLQNYPV